MSKVLIIGCGGVASVAIHKCCQVPEVFTEIYTLSLHDALPIYFTDKGVTDMSKVLIIGCGGVASVAIHKCCQRSEEHTSELQSH